MARTANKTLVPCNHRNWKNESEHYIFSQIISRITEAVNTDNILNYDLYQYVFGLVSLV